MVPRNSKDEFEGSLAEALAHAESLFSQLLTLDPPDSSNALVRKLDTPAILHLQKQIIPEEAPQDSTSVFEQAMAIFDSRMRLTHPRCFCYIPACPSPLAWLGDLLTSVYNVNTASWDVSCGPSAVEQAMVSWLADQIGFPSTTGGCFVSGGSMANLTAIITARDEKLELDRRNQGVIYISDQTHISIAKALHIAGFHHDQIRIVPTDQAFRMNLETLQQMLTRDKVAGRNPFLIVANCGSTNTGSIDPLGGLADISEREGLWLHIDGAYGASIALSDRYRHLLDGISRADSISWDAHKWLFQTYGCGIILIRQAETLRHSFAIDAEYISHTTAPQGTTNFYNLGPELSRPARSMPLWFTLRALGRKRVGEMIDQGLILARTAEREIRQFPHWAIMAPATASIVTFRYIPPGLNEEELNNLNSKISSRLLEENIAAILTTKLRGKTTLRLCAMNPVTQEEDIIQVTQQLNALALSELHDLLNQSTY